MFSLFLPCYYTLGIWVLVSTCFVLLAYRICMALRVNTFIVKQHEGWTLVRDGRICWWVLLMIRGWWVLGWMLFLSCMHVISVFRLLLYTSIPAPSWDTFQRSTVSVCADDVSKPCVQTNKEQTFIYLEPGNCTVCTGSNNLLVDLPNVFACGYYLTHVQESRHTTP